MSNNIQTDLYLLKKKSYAITNLLFLFFNLKKESLKLKTINWDKTIVFKLKKNIIKIN